MWKEIISKGMFCLFFEQIVMKKKSQLLTYLVFFFFLFISSNEIVPLSASWFKQKTGQI